MAIAFDNYTGGSGTGTTVDVNHQVISNTNGLLLVGVYTGTNNSDVVTGVTYNGVAMTRVNTDQEGATNARLYLYGLVGPAAGTNVVEVSCSASRFVQVAAASYTGVSQTGFPDAQFANHNNGVATIVGTVTTVLNNCWLGGVFLNDVAAMFAGANTIMREAGDAFTIADSNGARSIGSNSISVTWTGNANCAVCMCSFAPALASTPTVFPQLFNLS